MRQVTAQRTPCRLSLRVVIRIQSCVHRRLVERRIRRGRGNATQKALNQAGLLKKKIESLEAIDLRVMAHKLSRR